MRTTNAAAGGEPALDAAREILARAIADEAAADEARARFRREPMPTMPPDERIGPLLEPGELLVAVRRPALLDRREPAPGERIAPALGGQLYVTSRRLVFVGRLTLSFALDAIEDTVVSRERLLLVFDDGRGIALQASQPRLLSVQIAAARSAARAGQGSEVSRDPRSAAR